MIANMSRVRWKVAALFLPFTAACRPDFQIKKFTSSEALYQASLREFSRRKWTNAIAGFDKLTLDLPTRDTLLTRSFWYLGKSYQGNEEFLLAAQAFGRIVEGFGDDSLADRAALESARSYSRLWRRTQLTPENGDAALDAYATLLLRYPDSPLAATAKSEAVDLRNRFAIKDYDNGMYYMKDKAYDSAILYFRTVVDSFADVPKARDAGLRLAEIYRILRYAEETTAICASLRERYEADEAVRRICPAIPATAAQPPPARSDTLRY